MKTRPTRAFHTLLVIAVLAASILNAQGVTETGKANPAQFDSEEAVLEFLQTAEVVSLKRVKTGINQPFKLRLRQNGVEVSAVFRDVDVRVAKFELNGTLRTNFRDSALFEVAAYRLSEMLDLNMVPPTVVRKVNGEKGSVQLWVDGAMTEGDRQDKKLSAPRPLEWARLRQIRWIFDALVHNDDRNLGNSLIDSDWNLWLIDHTRAFYPFDRLIQQGQLTHIEANLWDRLQSIAPDEVRDQMKGVLERREIEALLKRWNKLIKHYRSQIAERGESRVVFLLDRSPAS